MTGGRPYGRPRGAVREAVATWAREWAAGGRPGGLPLAELVEYVPGLDARSPADRELLRRTVDNMVKAGELRKVGAVPRPGRYGRPAGLYAPPAVDADDGAARAAAVLSAAFAGWAGESTFCDDENDA